MDKDTRAEVALADELIARPQLDNLRLRLIRENAAIQPNMSAWLDLLRGGAALAVLFGHVEGVLYRPLKNVDHSSALHVATKAILAISWHAHEAVILFFVLSGYLVGGTFLARLNAGSGDYAHYIASRLARMFTVVVPAVALTFLLGTFTLVHYGNAGLFVSRPYFFPDWYSISHALSWPVAACNLAFLQMIACFQYGSNLSLWSLSNEMIYYFFWITLLAIPRRPFLSIVAIAIAALMLSSSLLPHNEGAALQYFSYFAIWMLGALIFVLNKSAIPSTVIIAAGMAGSIGVTMAGGEQSLYRDLMDSVVAGAILLMLEKRNVSFPLPRKPVEILAQFSFSLYAIHLPVILLLLGIFGMIAPQPESWRTHAWFMAISITTLAVSYIFYLLFESQTNAIRAVLQPLLRTYGGRTIKPHG